MRVLALSTSYPKGPKDSTAPFVRSISHGLARHGLDVHLLLPKHPDLTWAHGDPPAHLYTYPYAPKRWRRLHVWGFAGALVADTSLRPTALAVAPAAAISAVVYLTGLARCLRPDVLHAHWLLPNGPLAALVSQHTGIPLAISVHGSGVFLAERHAVLARAARYALRRAVQLTACSGDLAERAVRLGASASSTTVIPYGVEATAFTPASDAERERARVALGLSTNTFVILAVGRLVAKKGFEFLIRALPPLVDGTARPTLIIAGSGDLERELRELASECGVGECARFLGNVDRERITRLFHAADVLAVPSIHDAAGNVDGLPNVVLEGLASGLPLVASRVAGIPEVIQSALRRLAIDGELRRRLAKAARQTARETLDWSLITARYADTLAKAASGVRKRTHE
jgi:glycosyltransferase involved in cell wall biosynthesis